MNTQTHTQVSLKEFETLISTVGRDVTILGQGEPGIGKSSVFHSLKASPQFADYECLYLDCALLDVGDLQIPVVSGGKYAFTPNAMFVNDRPMLIMMDEIGKAPRPVQNTLLPMSNGEKRLGNLHLHPDTRVFATTNLSSDGVGDTIAGHARGRMCVVEVAKPNADEMVAYGTGAGWDASVLAWVGKYPHCMDSYTMTPEKEMMDNPYPYNPRRVQGAYVCPRSLEKASHISKQRHLLSPSSFIAALAGTVGESAARDMQAFFAVGDALPDWARVTAYPDTCPVPDDAVAQTILVLDAVTRVDKTTVNGWLDYMTRLRPEVQSLFVSQAMKGSKAALIVTNPKFTAYALNNAWLY